MGQPRPRPKGAGSQRFPILGVLSIYSYTLCRKATKFDVVTRGEGAYILDQRRLPSQESGIPELTNFF